MDEMPAQTIIPSENTKDTCCIKGEKMKLKMYYRGRILSWWQISLESKTYPYYS